MSSTGLAVFDRSRRAFALTLVISLATLVRVAGLGASGFSDDEINKVRAIDAYGRFDFSANAEHPMLMKLAEWGSMSAARWWNAHHAPVWAATISPEAALRLPNAIVGGATTGVVYLVAEALFDATVGVWAAVFWALDVNAAAINRIGKEDSFLVFFLLLAIYLYERGKLASPHDARRDRWYAWSGASFGLMLASKYMPHYFGLHTLFNCAADRTPDDNTLEKRKSFYVLMGLAFLVANFAVALPATWRYVVGYVQGDTARHSGYFFARTIYINVISATPWGLPPTFYLAFFFTKVPLFVLGAAGLGVVWVVRHPTHRGATFVRVFLVFTLLPYSLVASKFLRYMLPALAVLDVAAAVGMMWMMTAIGRIHRRNLRELLTAAVLAVAIVPSFVQQMSTAPFYGLAQNALGAHLAPRAWLFPDDELYDAGVREAVAPIAATAAPGAVVCSEIPEVVREYLARGARSDIRSCSLSHDGLPMHASETWVIVQDSHTYFENAAMIDQLRRRMRPWTEIQIGGVTAVQVFHLHGHGRHAQVAP